MDAVTHAIRVRRTALLMRDDINDVGDIMAYIRICCYEKGNTVIADHIFPPFSLLRIDASYCNLSSLCH